MSNGAPFTLHIFVANGDPDGLRLVERSNWIGKAIMFPRALYPQVRGRPEFQQIGVYLLLGPREEGDGETMYIGEGDPVRPRLEDHYAKKDFWTRAVFFIAGPGHLNKADVQYLEAQLVNKARAAKRTPLDNGNKPSEPTISERDRAAMDVFLDNILGMLPVLGIHAFEQTSLKAGESQGAVLTCQGRGVTATGVDTPKGFVVQGGSFCSKDETPSLRDHFPSISELRADILKSGVLVLDGDKFRFTQDYTFSSPSLASAVVLGRSSNGRTDWKDASGRTLKEIQETQAASY
ncbi:GIY-YIG nuclease family protein [Bradyrhizobium japonicum]|uniref:GIY-YIG nuclease family protein n=1 Tax=Bradyrhizobium japonicum TaxID=375 RepID=UPI00339AE561